MIRPVAFEKNYSSLPTLSPNTLMAIGCQGQHFLLATFVHMIHACGNAVIWLLLLKLGFLNQAFECG